MNSKKEEDLISNLMTAFLAQGISLLMSIFMSFIVPKFLGNIEYGYWQLFIFYVGYVGFFHFGYNDGVYLRMGGKRYEELDHRLLGTQFKVFIVVEIIIAWLIAFIGNWFSYEIERRYVWIFVALYLVVNNLHLFWGCVFQSVNRTKIYSKSVIIDRVFVLVFIVILLLEKETNFLPFIITYTLSKCFSFLYLGYYGRKIIFLKITCLKSALKDMRKSFLCGIKLTIANVMSMLVLGIGRVFIDNAWGIEVFGQISLALSLTNFFLVFIQQVSMVLFPALRRTSEEHLRVLYNELRIILGLFLPSIFVGYFLIKITVGLWLPQYTISLKYLALLLPLCTFDGKMQMLCNTYLKVMRQEKKLLQVNAVAFTISFVLCAFSTYIFQNMTMVIVSMVFSVALRSALSELYLSRIMKINITKMMIQEIFITGIFMYVVWFLEERIAFCITVCIFALYIIINRNAVSFDYLKNKIKRS